MKHAVAILVAVMLLTGCAPSGGETAVPEPAPPAESDRPAVADDGPPDDPSASRIDDSGRTPEEVVRELIETKNRGDWEAAYAQYADPWVEYADAEDEWIRSDARHEDFVVHETRVTAERAFVRVTYTWSETLPDGTRHTVSLDEPGQWWRVEKVDGEWKTGWMPAQ